MEKLDNDLGWLSAPTPLDRVEAVKKRLKAFSVTDPKDVETLLGVLQRFGVFHDPVPRPGDPIATARQIRKRDQKAGRAVEKQKISSELFQVRRGGRIIPRFANPTDRARAQKGRRREPEVTQVFQILDRFLAERDPQSSRNYREECIADVYRAARNILLPQHQCTGLWCKIYGCPRRRMIEVVRTRLKEALPLDDFHYHWALGRKPEGWEPVPLGLTIPLAPGATKAETTVTTKRSKEPREDALNKTVVKALRNAGVRILDKGKLEGKLSLECQRCGYVWTPDPLLPVEQSHETWWRCPEGCNETA